MSTTIVVLEDDAVLQELLCEVLQDEGFQVIPASSLSQLLAAPPKQADLLITDLLINTDVAGINAIRQVRQATRANLPAVVCTAAIKQVDELRPVLNQLGARVVTKPFNIQELIDVINATLKPVEQHRDLATPPLRTAFA